jgi:hypothetical protein
MFSLPMLFAAALAGTASAAPTALAARGGACNCKDPKDILLNLQINIQRIYVELKAKVDVNIAGLITAQIYINAILEVQAQIEIAIKELQILVTADISVLAHITLDVIVELLVKIFITICLLIEICVKANVLGLIKLDLSIFIHIHIVIQALIAVIIQICARINIDVKVLLNALCIAIKAQVNVNVDIKVALKACINIVAVVQIFAVIGLDIKVLVV